MTLADIYGKLHDGVGSDGKLVLDGGLFPELGAALVPYGVTQVEVDGAQVAQNGSVTVDGQALLLGETAGQHLHLDVSGNTQLTATLTYTLPASWSFATGFPGLPESYKHFDGNP